VSAPRYSQETVDELTAHARELRDQLAKRTRERDEAAARATGRALAAVMRVQQADNEELAAMPPALHNSHRSDLESRIEALDEAIAAIRLAALTPLAPTSCPACESIRQAGLVPRGMAHTCSAEHAPHPGAPTTTEEK
jgi:hypothetical protein